jgi:hypothetical protein
MGRGFVLKLNRTQVNEDDFAAAYEALSDQYFADGALWFGWCETDIRLPRPLHSEAFDLRWDLVRIFSPIAELRAQRRGNERLILMLTENAALVNQLKQGLEGFNVSLCEFAAEQSCRVLVGQKPRKPVGSNPNALIEVIFPRELDYGIPVANERERLIAGVQGYFDDEHRLRFVRYCFVKGEQIGQREVETL